MENPSFAIRWPDGKCSLQVRNKSYRNSLSWIITSSGRKTKRLSNNSKCTNSRVLHKIIFRKKKKKIFCGSEYCSNESLSFPLPSFFTSILSWREVRGKHPSWSGGLTFDCKEVKKGVAIIRWKWKEWKTHEEFFKKFIAI